jgi:type I restriction enzyme M protein
VFAPYTEIPSNLIFFEEGTPTKDIWYYELQPPGERKKYSKTKPIQYEEFEELKKWWDNRVENENAWKVLCNDVVKINEQGACFELNLDIKNPNKKKELEYKDPQLILEGVLAKEREIMELMKEIKVTINQQVVYE